MYRIKAVNHESDTEEEDYTKVTKEAEVCIYHNLNKYSIIYANIRRPFTFSSINP